MARKLIVDNITTNSSIFSEKGVNVIIKKNGKIEKTSKYIPTKNFSEIEVSDDVFEKIMNIVNDVKDVSAMDKLRNINLEECLDEKFVAYKGFAQAMKRAIQFEENIIVYGPGGYGKSDMMRHILKKAGVYEQAHIMSFGEDTTESSLWGGVKYNEMLEKGRTLYNIEDSFIQKEIAVFEEIFDAPTNTLLALKDTLEAKEFRKGPQREMLKTKIVIAFTNKSPQEIDELGEYARALVSRFRIEYLHSWDTHNAKDYNNLLSKVYKNESPEIINIAAETFSELAKVRNISPRIAIAGAKLMFSQKENGPIQMIDELKYITELARIPEEIECAKSAIEDVAVRVEMENLHSEACSKIHGQSISLEEKIKIAKETINTLSDKRVSDDLWSVRRDFIEDLKYSISKICGI